MDSAIYSLETHHDGRPVITISLESLSEVSPTAAAGPSNRLPSGIDIANRFEDLYAPARGGVDGFDLVVVGAQAEGATSKLWSVVRMISRRYREEMRDLYIVHASWFTRVFIPLFLPFFTFTAFNRVHCVPALSALYHHHGISLAGLKVSVPTLLADSKALSDQRGSQSGSNPSEKRSQPRQSFVQSCFETLRRTLSFFLAPPSTNSDAASQRLLSEDDADTQTIDEDPTSSSTGIPRSMKELREAILSEPCISTQGIFRRSSHASISVSLSSLLALPEKVQPLIQWRDVAIYDPLIPPKTLLSVVAKDGSPVIPQELYPIISRTTSPASLKDDLIPHLSVYQFEILSFLARLISDLVPHEPQTRMSSLALATVISPVLIAGPDAMQDAALCLAQGQKLPEAMTRGHRDLLQGDGTVVGVLMLWSEHCEDMDKT